MRILQLNVEGIPQSKCGYISRICRKQSVDVVCIQKTHIGEAHQGYKMGAHVLFAIHGSAMYIKNDIEEYCAEPLSKTNGLETIKLELKSFTIISVYKAHRVAG